MEIKLRIPGGTVISSNSKKRTDAKKTASDTSSEYIEEIRETANEVRELIRQSNELDQLEKHLSQVGYAEWVRSGDRERFYEIMKALNSGAATAREYWEERHNSSPNHRKNRIPSTSSKPNKKTDDGFEPQLG
ncbi:hypothetical protein SAMN03159316_2867 [Pseudomonas sp. NFR02]|uniref:hypothetical protein n=1 Tax=Pseudomonas sp. NFR02 TaxID=1566229 RepID=UPI0009101540|nr:hypothetical protein [Pseudomonas sp. NFR02]SFX84395.1 hypothetical protein SAMN03159316_2867 [Pseudomonas sp. NFR02]